MDELIKGDGRGRGSAHSLCPSRAEPTLDSGRGGKKTQQVIACTSDETPRFGVQSSSDRVVVLVMAMASKGKTAKRALASK